MTVNTIRLTDEAGADLQAGRTFYSCRHPGVGDYYWDSLFANIESLTLYAGIHIKQHGCYRMLARHFPYSIYYQVQGDLVIVIAVLPMKRDSAWIKSRLAQRLR